ncbi:hypothetical protein E1B28_010967 [Marasmius oreades]|uniref:Uncharacterized protein n=1 Tax=Marasmius oreades TaxID=181124 RepID=A0A9P7URK4_9AGAR|nr:uncharacterized protein E1B28_010967 [Marasmius oreades]KAG7089269.1 hypothetical protein E1B28_010967 [Marasmius oreades]
MTGEKRKPTDKGEGEAGVVDNATNYSNTSLSDEQPLPKRARTTSELPDVNGIILEEFVESYLPKKCSNDKEKAYILHNLVHELSSNSQWEEVLNLEFKVLDHCKTAVTNDADLGNIVSDGFKANDWKPLFNDLRLRREREILQPSTSAESNRSMETDRSVATNIQYFKEAFEKDYCTPNPGILLRAMDEYDLGMRRPYNRSFSVVQSSGMGKSRLMDHSATLRFAIPFNLHEDMESGATYPPFDYEVRKFLTTEFEREVDAITRPLVFLQALFNETVAELQSQKTKITKGTPQEIASKWYKWMNVGSTVDNVGTNRTMLYDRVVAKARKLEQEPVDHQKPLEHREKALNTAARSLVDCLQKLYNYPIPFCAIVYFDEAHTLSKSLPEKSHQRTPYYALMHVLNMINDKQIFFVFLSTNSSLKTSAPTKAAYPSIRVQNNTELIPPFFELRFDIFCRKFTSEAKEAGKLTLEGVCDLGQMAKFGRPMWHSYYQSLPEDEKHKMIDLAVLKLRGDDHNNADLAALDSRVLIPFDPYQLVSRTTEVELVRSHMRCIYNIPADRQFVRSAYLSEPVLSEAAAVILNSPRSGVRPGRSIVDEAPRILANALTTGLLAKGERGELIARTLLTVAHDEAAKLHSGSKSERLRYHRPIRLVHFLEKLLAPEVWNLVRQATPVHAYKDDPKLEVAFDKSWINFSHFVELGNHEMFSWECATEMLKQGAAIQIYANQRNQDLGIPLHNGGLGSAIDIDCTGLSQYQIKNSLTNENVEPDPEAAGKCPNTCPILSIVMQLGVGEGYKGPPVEIKTNLIETNTPAGNTRSSSDLDDIKCRHYSIVLYGCTAATYSCIGGHAGTYASLLQIPTLFQDYPRKTQPELLDTVHTLSPQVVDTVWKN